MPGATAHLLQLLGQLPLALRSQLLERAGLLLLQLARLGHLRGSGAQGRKASAGGLEGEWVRLLEPAAHAAASPGHAHEGTPQPHLLQELAGLLQLHIPAGQLLGHLSNLQPGGGGIRRAHIPCNRR